MKNCKLKRLLDDALEKYQIPCSDLMVCVDGQKVYRYMNGTSDEKKIVPIKGDELYYLYSVSKPITCVAALQLYEKGMVDLEDDVAAFIPEFRNIKVKKEARIVAAMNSMKIKHLFTMTSGMNYDLNSLQIKEQIEKNPYSTTLELVKAMADSPLEFEPGSHFLYGLNHDVLAAVIEVVSGMSFGEYLQKNIFDICGMKNTYVGCTQELKEKLCCQYLYDEGDNQANIIEKENPYILTSKYQSGGAGIVSCVEDYMLFANELTNGERLLKRSTVDLMRAGHISGNVYTDFQNCKPGYSYGLGVRTNIDNRFSARGEFGWDGAAGSYVLMDPDNHITIFYATHIKDRGEYLYGRLHPLIRDEVYKILNNK